MFEVIASVRNLRTTNPLEILKEAYFKLNRQKDVIGTSKRIAQAYVQLGQLSSAILEYETILQRFPDDADVQAALKEIEDKATNLASQPNFSDAPVSLKPLAANGARPQKAPPVDVDDGRQMMVKIFVDVRKFSSPPAISICAGPSPIFPRLRPE